MRRKNSLCFTEDKYGLGRGCGHLAEHLDPRLTCLVECLGSRFTCLVGCLGPRFSCDHLDGLLVRLLPKKFLRFLISQELFCVRSQLRPMEALFTA